MPVSKKRKYRKKRKNVLKQVLRKSESGESSILIHSELNGTFTVTDEQTGAVLLSGLDADETGAILANNIVDYAIENGLKFDCKIG